MKLLKRTLMDEFYIAWWYIKEHPTLRSNDLCSVDIEVFAAKVNPNTKKTDKDSSLNTEVQVWLECMSVDVEGIGIHHVSLDCGGDTYEEAIIKMAKRLKKKFGDYGK